MIYLIMLAGGAIGITAHTLFKMIKSRKTALRKGVKIKFRQVSKDYIENEGDTLLLGIIVYCGLLFIASEIIDLKNIDVIDYSIPLKERLFHYHVSKFIKLSSIIAGIACSSCSYMILGTADEKIRDKVSAILKLQDDGPSDN